MKNSTTKRPLLIILLMLIFCLALLVSCGEDTPTDQSATYTVTFVADGVVVDAQTYTADNMTITEPAIPAKNGYTATWEPYTLTTSDLTVNAIYTLMEYTNITYTPLTSTTCAVATVESNAKEITIPSVHEGLTVVGIGEQAFVSSTTASMNETLETIILPNTIEYIADYAFAFCTKLSSITLPESVIEIGPYAFSYCKSLSSVTIPASVSGIGRGAFSLCDSLTDVYISDLAAWCNINFAVIGVDYSACPFEYADHLYLNGTKIDALVIPDNIIRIKDYAFYGFSELTSITIPAGCTEIGEFAFFGCTGLKTVRTADLAAWCRIRFDNPSANPLCNGGDLYLNDNKIVELTTPDGITSINAYAFNGCAGFTSVTISDTVTYIGDYAFSGCTGLTHVTVGNDVTSIGISAFSGCTQLLSFTFTDTSTWYRTKNYTDWCNKANGNKISADTPYGNAQEFKFVYDGYYFYKL